jgi:hypothetical protein
MVSQFCKYLMSQIISFEPYFYGLIHYYTTHSLNLALVAVSLCQFPYLCVGYLMTLSVSGLYSVDVGMINKYEAARAPFFSQFSCHSHTNTPKIFSFICPLDTVFLSRRLFCTYSSVSKRIDADWSHRFDVTVRYKFTDVSDERTASIFSVEKYS